MDIYKIYSVFFCSFRKHISGQCLQSIHADCLEGHVAYYIWKSFIIQDSEDRDLLFKNLKSFDVPIIIHVDGEGHYREPFRLSNEMLALGISSRLDNVFDAPHAVKEVLISQFKLDFSYIGSKETDEKSDMANRLGIFDVWTPENHYRWFKSRYGDHITANVESVEHSHLLLCNLNVGEIETLKSRELQHEEVISTIEANLKDLQIALREKEDKAASFQREREEIVNFIQSKKKNCYPMRQGCKLLASKKHAESVAMITHELERAFLEMPKTIEDLEAAIQDTVSEANSILFLNHNILEECEIRHRKIEELTNMLENGEKTLKSRVDEINTLKESWLSTLKNLMICINETFSRNFQEMAVTGEVSLDEHDMDFDHYGILIKVKFRQTGQLQVLSAHHQSGGERSVSTILYLVSLQDLTNCPFRVVDEINQGMDPVNERNMFQQLVRAASQPNTPQCFLLTPKLLPNLEYSDACSIVTVMNGPWIEQPSKVWSGGESWGSVQVPIGGNLC